MLFLTFVASIGVLFLLNTLWRLFVESHRNVRSGSIEAAKVIRFDRRMSSQVSDLGATKRKSLGKVV